MLRFGITTHVCKVITMDGSRIVQAKVKTFALFACQGSRPNVNCLLLYLQTRVGVVAISDKSG